MVGILGYTINISFQEIIILAIILALFLIVSRKVIKTIFNIIWISIASASFPFVMKFLGFDFSTDVNSILFFAASGLVLYVIYMLARVVYAILGLAEKAGKVVSYPVRSAKKGKEDKIKKKMEKFLKDKRKKEEK